ncbi:ArsA family ATPase [Streptomyces sp. NPDC001922]|uniref:ArsA family ATPase n=1 Tax=Streptomyces sp. NPDC001922 TaxID=3364624 RepID=UPI0036B8555A
MNARTILVTGAGGAGRTTVAAAQALAAARRGLRTLVLTTDRFATLEAALGLPAGAAARRAAQPPSGPDGTGEPARRPGPWSPPVQAAPNLWAARLDPGEHFRTELLDLQERCSAALGLLGAAPLDREEVTEVPGAPQLALLRALRALHPDSAAAAGEQREDAAGPAHGVPAPGTPGTADREPSAAPAGPPAGWDVAVLDLPPVPDAPAVLALPEQLRRYLRRLLPSERQAARALRPLLAQLAGVPMPAQWLYETADRCAGELAAAQAVIEADSTVVRLVVEPGPAAVETLRRAHAGLALHGLRTDAVIANRLLPTGSADPWLAAASGQQQAALKTLADDLPAGTALWELPHLGHDPRGSEDLAELLGRGNASATPRAGGAGSGGANGPSRDGGASSGDAKGTVGHEDTTSGHGDGADADRSGTGQGSGAAVGGGGAASGPAGDLAPDAEASGSDRTDFPADGGTEGAEGAEGAGTEVPGGPGHTSRVPGRVEDRLAAEGVLLWRLPLPGAERGDLDLSRRGDELVVTVGPFRRILPLPSALRRCTVTGAGLADGELGIRFTPDPGLWPRTGGGAAR